MTALAGARAVVTGAGGGIGGAIVSTLLDEGATVCGWELAGAAAGRRDPRCTYLDVDVTDEGDVQAAAGTSLAAMGGVDILVTAAGLLRTAPVPQMSLADFEAMWRVNVVGVFLSVKHLAPAMSGGAVVTLGSVAGSVGHTTSTAYGATKGAVASMSRGLAQELSVRGTRVVCVCPGWVDTGFTHQVLAGEDDRARLEAAAAEAHLLGRMATAAEVAEVVAFLASPRASFVTGTEIVVDGGFLIKR